MRESMRRSEATGAANAESLAALSEQVASASTLGRALTFETSTLLAADAASAKMVPHSRTTLGLLQWYQQCTGGSAPAFHMDAGGGAALGAAGLAAERAAGPAGHPEGGLGSHHRQ